MKYDVDITIKLSPSRWLIRFNTLLHLLAIIAIFNTRIDVTINGMVFAGNLIKFSLLSLIILSAYQYQHSIKTYQKPFHLVAFKLPQNDSRWYFEFLDEEKTTTVAGSLSSGRIWPFGIHLILNRLPNDTHENNRALKIITNQTAAWIFKDQVSDEIYRYICLQLHIPRLNS